MAWVRAQGDPYNLQLEDLFDEMVQKGVDYTMVRCGVAIRDDDDDEDDNQTKWEEETLVEETERYAACAQQRFAEAAERV